VQTQSDSFFVLFRVAEIKETGIRNGVREIARLAAELLSNS
jgi:hypothetical protein